MEIRGRLLSDFDGGPGPEGRELIRRPDGDDAGSEKPIPELGELELVLDQSGLALEKVRFEQALHALERRARDST